MMAPHLLRSLAIAIAVMGLVDPAITRSRPAPAAIAVVTPAGSTAETTVLAERVARTLDGRYEVTRTSSASAAVVAVGDRLLDDADDVTVPSIAVLPAAPAIRIAAVAAPQRASLADRVTISASLVVSGAAGRTVEVTLRAGAIAADRITRQLSSAQERLQIPLAFVPTSEGVTPVRVMARLDSAKPTEAQATADLAVTIDRRVWPVFVFARRPSWMSTFVGRILEDDPRFSVTTRTLTSTAAVSSTPDSPASVSDAAALTRYPVIVVGAPETLTDADVSGLETYLRRRGGAVIALFDGTATDKPHAIDRLLNVRVWRSETAAAPVAIEANGSPALEATETMWPEEIPAGAERLAKTGTVWQIPIGAGRVVVSGALDSWRYRESPNSAFRDFWRRTIATAASASPNPIGITIDRSVVPTGVAPTAFVRLRDVTLAPRVSGQSVSVAATIDGPDGHSTVRLWPDILPGHFRATLPGSSRAGAYRLTVTNGGDSATANWMVATSAVVPNPDERALVEQWAHSRGGTTIAANQLNSLPAAIDRVLAKPRQDTRWHPMRQSWWIVPFALLLGSEWWLRRRR